MKMSLNLKRMNLLNQKSSGMDQCRLMMTNHQMNYLNPIQKGHRRRRVTSVSLGPTVTQYELKPGQGVKVNRIANLADDLALALAAKSIRIEAPIPGKPYVGIEVPNDTQATVGFRDMIEHAPFDDNPLNVPLGRDVTVDKQNADAVETGDPIMQKMPYIVAIVDEFADLMSTVGSEIEVSIARLGAKARAAGIHMIFATQRPDVKNASGIDSRTILDSNGAEKLLGRGDMIFAPPGKPTQRVQGAFISNADVTSVVDFVKAQQEVQYSEAMTVTDEEVAQDSSDMSDGIDFVITTTIRIGYNRAARLIDDLEASGYIGPADGSRPRHVNVSDGSSYRTVRKINLK
ncbi:hypothetical protein Pfo_031329 [Paulownia fortunei]|nr:hypothetical protein Pfo_031329 [Paulownia fortunei]